MHYIALAALLACCTSAAAQGNSTYMPDGSKEIKLALALGNEPRSPGSAQRETFIVPLFSVRWANGLFVEMNEFGVHLSSQPSLDYGLVAVPAFSRATTLPGEGARGDRRFTPQVGGFLNYQLAHGMNLTSGLLYGGSYDRRGLRLRFGAQFWLPVADHHSLGLVGALVLANRSALQANFAVAPEQARTMLPAHEVGSGLHSTAIGARWHWELTHKVTLASMLEWRRLHGSAANSPRVQQAGAVTMATMVIYGF